MVSSVYVLVICPIESDFKFFAIMSLLSNETSVTLNSGYFILFGVGVLCRILFLSILLHQLINYISWGRERAVCSAVD